MLRVPLQLVFSYRLFEKKEFRVNLNFPAKYRGITITKVVPHTTAQCPVTANVTFADADATSPLGEALKNTLSPATCIWKGSHFKYPPGAGNDPVFGGKSGE